MQIQAESRPNAGDSLRLMVGRNHFYPPASPKKKLRPILDAARQPLADNKRVPQPPHPFKNSFRAWVAGDGMGEAVASL